MTAQWWQILKISLLLLFIYTKYLSNDTIVNAPISMEVREMVNWRRSVISYQYSSKIREFTTVFIFHHFFSVTAINYNWTSFYKNLFNCDWSPYVRVRWIIKNLCELSKLNGVSFKILLIILINIIQYQSKSYCSLECRKLNMKCICFQLADTSLALEFLEDFFLVI